MAETTLFKSKAIESISQPLTLKCGAILPNRLVKWYVLVDQVLELQSEAGSSTCCIRMLTDLSHLVLCKKHSLPFHSELSFGIADFDFLEMRCTVRSDLLCT